MAKQVRCPICGEAFDAETSASLPFCSNRCRLIDLGRWLDEKYAVPVEGEGEEEEFREGPPLD